MKKVRDKTIYVIGHINPDTDSICSAICYAYLLNRIYGGKIIPARAGEINSETKFVLKKWGSKNPIKLTDLNNKNVILVDHNEVSQAVKNVKKANVIEIVDNHPAKITDTIMPIPIENEPSGATASLITERFHWFNSKITKQIAGLLLSALLSDTLLLKSPSTTKKDKILAKGLAKIAKVKLKKYGQEVLSSGSINFSGKNKSKTEIKKIILTDFKIYQKNKRKIAIGQILTTTLTEILKQKETILQEMEKLARTKKLQQLFLMVTTIKNGQTHLFYVGNKQQIEKKFQKKSKYNLDKNKGLIHLPKISSRKDQVVPKVI